ncbi:MAG: NAD-dependent epimerase/dehydratase family protein [Flavobacteriaceae bacterium]|nr:NAD-dependent epimerase/dehydratase family protein [Flavobacteriaceae bacterium]
MVLVTGGTGFLGSWLICHLLESGQQVRAIKRQTSSLKEFEFIANIFFKENKEALSRLEWVGGDILDIPSLEEAMAGCEKVYHAAAVVSFNKRDHQMMRLTNVEGTANVANLCLELRVQQLCYISSVAAFGRTGNDTPIDEKTSWENSRFNSEYSKTKHQAELEVWRAIEEGLNAVILNPSIINGPGDWHKGTCRMYHNIKKGLPFYTHGGGGYVDVRDVCRAAIMLMDKQVSGEQFLLSSQNVLYKDFFDKIAAGLQVKAPSIYVAPWLSRIGLPLEVLRSKLMKSDPIVTKELATTAHIVSRYSSAKIIEQHGFQFTLLDESVRYTCYWYS